jgi:hypothetical protein
VAPWSWTPRGAIMLRMTNALRRFRNAVTSLGSDSRPEFKSVDASPALYDDGSWLTPKPA